MRLGEDDKDMRNFRWENKEAVHVRQMKTSKLEVRSFPKSGRMQLRAGTLAGGWGEWKEQ